MLSILCVWVPFCFRIDITCNRVTFQKLMAPHLQDTHVLLSNTEAVYCTHKAPPLVSVLSQISPLHSPYTARLQDLFLGAFAKLGKATISFVMSDRPSTRPASLTEQLSSHCTEFH